MFDLPTNLVEFLTWIVYGGGSAIAVSWILEKLPWYQEKTAEAKRNIFFGIVTTITLIIYAVLNYVPDTVLAALTPYFGIIAITFVNVYIGTGFHRANKTVPQVVANEVTVVSEKNMTVEVKTPAETYEIKG